MPIPRLTNTISFSNLVQDVPMSLAHGLTDGFGNPVVPDLIIPEDVNAFTFAATETHLIATRISGPSAVRAYVEAFVNTRHFRVGQKPPPMVVGSGAAGASSQSAITTIVFRPGDPDGSRGNVFTTWQEAYDAVTALSGLGAIYLEFDDRFGATKIPAGVWQMTNDTIWTHYNSSPTPTIVELEDGCSIQMVPAVAGEQRILTIVGTNMTVLSNRQGATAPFVDTSFVLAGNRTRLGNSSALALPMIVSGGNNFVAIAGTNSLGGIGQGATCPAPLMDCAGGGFLVAGGHGFVSDNAFTDSVGGGTVTLRFLNDGFCGGSFPGQTYSFPALIAAGGTVNWLCQVRDRHLVNAHVVATPYAATYNELVLVDSSALAITVNAPRANPAKGERLVVKDVTGNAAANNITIAGTGGDTVQNGSITTNGQAKTWVADGAGTWIHIATS
jgi:hypothetical protein